MKLLLIVMLSSHYLLGSACILNTEFEATIEFTALTHQRNAWILHVCGTESSNRANRTLDEGNVVHHLYIERLHPERSNALSSCFCLLLITLIQRN